MVVLSVCLAGCHSFSLSSHHDVTEYTPVFAAATACNQVEVQKAVELDHSLIKATEWENKTLLHDAIEQSCQDEAVYLLNQGANINAKTKEGMTPLHIAAQNGDLNLINLLINRGADINAVDGSGWTPLDRATKWEHSDAADLLKQHGGQEGE
jgi:ankyrin repeat protein